VAAPLVIYLWGLQEMRHLGWIAVLFFAICGVMRLARFNVSAREEGAKGGTGAYFQGLPAPAGALMAMLPMVFAFALPGLPQPPAPLVALAIAGVVLQADADITRERQILPAGLCLRGGGTGALYMGGADRALPCLCGGGDLGGGILVSQGQVRMTAGMR
jgi:hypothetical protein